MEASCIVQTYRNSCKLFSESDKKIGQSNLKKSGERSRVILALLFEEVDVLHIFSELALVTHKPRAATVYAIGKTKVAGKPSHLLLTAY